MNFDFGIGSDGFGSHLRKEFETHADLGLVYNLDETFDHYRDFYPISNYETTDCFDFYPYLGLLRGVCFCPCLFYHYLSIY